MRISDWSSDVCSDLRPSKGWSHDPPRPRRPSPARARGAAARGRQRDARYRRDAQRSGRAGPNGRHDHRDRRSEEHTSELQSLMRISYAVFCLKKKKNYTEKANDKFTKMIYHSQNTRVSTY